jgi:hypothetical protein
MGAGGSGMHNSDSSLPSVQGGAMLKATGNHQLSKGMNFHGASSKWHSQQDVRALIPFYLHCTHINRAASAHECFTVTPYADSH